MQSFDKARVLHGDCLDVLKTLADNSVDAVVTDPPYGLSFMGKKWDYDVPSVEVWAECLRVLKPGGHLLAFAGTRTQHRMAVRIEDAGFEIRDMIAWVYGSGFPKSHDVSKAIDKGLRGQRVVSLIQALIEQGHTLVELGDKAGIPSLESSFRDWTIGGHRPEERSWDRLLSGLGFSEADGLNIISRKTVSLGGGAAYTFREGEPRDYVIKETAPATEAARQWQGWGTALKPALEPITVARKPLIGTVAENVLAHGTGGLNIDGCRVGTFSNNTPSGLQRYRSWSDSHTGQNRPEKGSTLKESQGRWPANLIHDGGEPAELLGDAARFFYCAKASKRDRDEGLDGFEAKERERRGLAGEKDNTFSRNSHPTVKPTDLMRYLCRLVTPPNGIVLDPFTGSGSTGKAAVLEGFQFIGIEREAEYVDIARARIESAYTQPQEPDPQQGLF